jgi:hypothetical protein
MVHMRTGDFSLDVPELSDAYARVVGTRPHEGSPIGPRGTAPASPPLLPPPSVSIEQLLAMQNKLILVLTKNFMHRGVC